jgi:hypothetical protein
MPTKWSDDVFAEQTIKKFGIVSSAIDVPLSKIDWEESRKNGARISAPISQEHVYDLAQAIKNGDSLPSPVLNAKNGKFVILSGNHRCLAAKEAGETEIPSYVIESTDDAVLWALPAALNAPTLQVSRQDRLSLAARSVERGITLTSASNIFSIPTTTLRNEIISLGFEKTLASHGIREGALTRTSLRELASIKNPNVFVPAARLAVASKMNAAECAQFSRDIRSRNTESQQISVVADKEKAIGPMDPSKPRVTVARSAGTSVKIAIGTLEKNLKARNISQWGITEKGEKIDFIERINQVCAGLKAIVQRSK